jgi:hypothetical protein
LRLIHIGQEHDLRFVGWPLIAGEVEMVKDAAETAAEVVEEVAAAVEKASAEVAEAEQLPEHGALRRAAALVERASREVAEEAHLAHDIIHKVSTNH